MLRTLTIAAALMATLLAPACADPLPRSSLITGLRLLAIATDIPEALPGQTVTITPLVVDPEGRAVSYEWSACILPAFADDDFGDYDTEDCNLRRENGEPDVTYLGTNEVVQYRVPDDLFDDGSVVNDVYGFEGEIPPEALILLASVIGVEVNISLRISAGGDTIRAFKRLKVSLSPSVNSNPEPLHFVLREAPTGEEQEADGFELEPLPTEYEPPAEGRCLATVGGVPPTISADTPWELVPLNLPETYDSYDVVGVSPDPEEPFQIVEVDEVYVLRFFSTLGTLSIEEDTFVDPDDDEPPTEHPGTGRWSITTFPDEVETVPVWIVTRDGRGGTVTCYDEVTVDRSEE